jgi:DNA-binding MarR family transcriptional regulator
MYSGLNVRGMSRVRSAVQEEIQQRKPFSSPAEEAVVALVRTADLLRRALTRVVEPQGLTLQQYNVLRILRGAGDAGLPTLAIRDRMIEEAAGITRLLDKLESAGYVVRERSTPDRRQVLCHITPAGLTLLADLDPPVDAMTESAFATLDEAEKTSLVELLGAVRVACRGDVS